MKQAPAKFKRDSCPRCGSPQTVLNGEWLRARRVAAGLSLRAMAARVGFTAAYLCDIEKNRRNCLPAMRAEYEALP